MSTDLETFGYSLARRTTGWRPYCRKCRRHIDDLTITFGLERVQGGIFPGQHRHTGINDWTFHCHGESITLHVDQRGPGEPKVSVVTIKRIAP